MPFISMTIRDNFGRTTSKQVAIESQVDLATYQTVAASVVTAYDGVIDGQIVRVDLVVESITGGTGAPEATANVDAAGLFSGYLDLATGKRASLRVPTFDLDLVGSDGSIDIEDAAVDTLLDLYLAAGPATISDGETMEEWISGRLER